MESENKRSGYVVRHRRAFLWSTISTLRRNRNLVAELIRRDIRERYISQALSWIWLVVQPAITTLVYLAIFAFVFNARVGADSSRSGYVTFLLSGLIPWIAVSDILNRAVVAVAGTPGFVKQMVFPVEVLPLKIFGSAALSFLLSSTIFLVFVLVTGRGNFFLIFGWPASVLCLAVFLTGAAYLLSAVGVFFKDIRDIVQLYTSIGLFASPALFPIDSISSPLKAVILLNPVAPFILMFQDSIYAGAPVHLLAWLIGPIVALLALVGGVWVFSVARPVMADVL